MRLPRIRQGSWSHALAVIDRHLPILLDWPTPNTKEKDIRDHVAHSGVYPNVFDDPMLTRKADAMSCPSANGSSMHTFGPVMDKTAIQIGARAAHVMDEYNIRRHALDSHRVAS